MYHLSFMENVWFWIRVGEEVFSQAASSHVPISGFVRSIPTSSTTSLNAVRQGSHKSMCCCLPPGGISAHTTSFLTSKILIIAGLKIATVAVTQQIS